MKLALRGLQRRFTFVDSARRQLPHVLLAGRRILLHQQDALLVVHRQDHRRACMPHDRPLDLKAVGIDGDGPPVTVKILLSNFFSDEMIFILPLSISV